jgi:YbbR domain-containing protein
MNNLRYKILAVLLATVIWYFVVGEERAEIGLTVPLELVNIPRNLIVVNNVTQAIDIRINGPKSLVRALSMENLRKSLDLSQARRGTVSFSISPEGIPLPRGVKITRISPTQAVVVLQNLVVKNVTIKPRLVGKPAPGFEVVGSEINYDQVQIAGPQDVLDNLDSLYTKPVEIEGLTSSLRQRTSLDFRNHQISLVKEVPLEVQVTIKKR